MKGKVVPLGLGLVGVALAEVYVVDPSIDQYKQKTDQSFYDLYQNPQNIVARAIQRQNPSFPFNSFSTDQRLTSTQLNTLPLITDMNSSSGPGLSVMGGKQVRWCYAYHPDGRSIYFQFEVDDDGNPKSQDVRAWGSYQYRYGWNSFRIYGTAVGIGWNTGSVRCVATCGGGCVRQRKGVRKLVLDTACRNTAVYRTEYERRRRCWRCGKSTCYGSWSSWYEVAGGQVEDMVSLTRGYVKGSVLRGYARSYKLY